MTKPQTMPAVSIKTFSPAPLHSAQKELVNAYTGLKEVFKGTDFVHRRIQSNVQAQSINIQNIDGPDANNYSPAREPTTDVRVNSKKSKRESSSAISIP